MSQPLYQFIEGPIMYWSIDNSIYVRIQTWKLECENILEAELSSLSDASKCKILLR